MPADPGDLKLGYEGCDGYELCIAPSPCSSKHTHLVEGRSMSDLYGLCSVCYDKFKKKMSEDPAYEERFLSGEFKHGFEGRVARRRAEASASFILKVTQGEPIEGGAHFDFKLAQEEPIKPFGNPIGHLLGQEQSNPHVERPKDTTCATRRMVKWLTIAAIALIVVVLVVWLSFT